MYTFQNEVILRLEHVQLSSQGWKKGRKILRFFFFRNLLLKLFLLCTSMDLLSLSTASMLMSAWRSVNSVSFEISFDLMASSWTIAFLSASFSCLLQAKWRAEQDFLAKPTKLQTWYYLTWLKPDFRFTQVKLSLEGWRRKNRILWKWVRLRYDYAIYMTVFVDWMNGNLGFLF